MSDKIISHGRGGAGNIAPQKQVSPEAVDLETPHIKGDHYTTGRGGQGNMAKNDPTNPSLAREAQDVSPAVRSTEGKTHIGRGGAANTAKNDEELNEAGGIKGTIEKVKEAVGLKK